MNQDAITIIVPCYNVEKYIEKSLKTLLNQTHKNIKIIAIDDCSTDNTYKTLQKIEKDNKEKITLYQNEQNKGLAYTRNRGIKLAKTKYIGFIDSDDYVDNTYYEKLLEVILEEDADIAIADMILVNDKDEKIAPTQKGINTEISNIKEAAIDNGLAASACNKLFKKESIEKYPFLEGKINEDVASVIPTILHANKIAYTNEVKYYYVQREKSIQNSKFSEKRFDIIDSVEVTLEKIKEIDNYKKYEEIIIYHQILMLYIYVITTLKGFKERQKYIKMFIKRQQNLRIEKHQESIEKYLKTRGKLRKDILEYYNKTIKPKISDMYQFNNYNRKSNSKIKACIS